MAISFENVVSSDSSPCGGQFAERCVDTGSSRSGTAALPNVCHSLGPGSDQLAEQNEVELSAWVYRVVGEWTGDDMAINEAEVDKLIKRRGCLTTLVILGWSGTLLVGLAYAGVLQLLGDANCEPTPGSSTYGEFGWSLMPPGPTCTFTAEVHGFDEVRGPTPVMTIWLVAVVIGAGACMYLLRSPFESDGSLRGNVPDGDDKPTTPGDRHVR